MRALAAFSGVAMLAAFGSWMAFALLPPKPQPLPVREGPALTAARTWGYQLQNVSAAAIPDPIDLLVVDYSRDGGAGRALSRREVAALARRSDGRLRIVLCYLSIGEAESYRGYWRDSWNTAPPVWLGPENSKWKGNYAVRFWDPGWQQLIVAQPQDASWAGWVQSTLFPPRKAYLDAIVDAGFDGVMLDRIDAYEKAAETRPSARAEMIAFVGAISAAGKRQRPGFMIVAQNAEELTLDAEYRGTVDAVVKEDLIFGEGGDGVPNDPTQARRTIATLSRAKAAGLPVFTVEYVTDAERQKPTLNDWRTLGFIGTFASRALNEPPMLPPLPPAEPFARPH